jgi:hypothetical protein
MMLDTRAMAAAEGGLLYRQDRDATLGGVTTVTALSVFREPERLITLGIREHLGSGSLRINPNPYGIGGGMISVGDDRGTFNLPGCMYRRCQLTNGITFWFS